MLLDDWESRDRSPRKRRGRPVPADGRAAADAVADGALTRDWADSDAIVVLILDHLPLVYNVVGRALNRHPDIDGVVQKIMTGAVSAAHHSSNVAVFRSRLLAACVWQVRNVHRTAVTATRPGASRPDGVPEADFAQLTIERLGLTAEQCEIAEAARWLAEDDRLLLALWWQEATGTLHRAELADALRLSGADLDQDVARLVQEVEASRVIARALRRAPVCGRLVAAADGWDGAPGPAWRDRLAAHVLNCPACAPRRGEMSSAEWLLGGLPLVPPPRGLTETTLNAVALDGHGPHGPHSERNAGRPGFAARHSPAGTRRVAHRSWRPSRSAFAVISAAVALCLAGGIAIALRSPGPSHATSAATIAGTPSSQSGLPGKGATAPARASSAPTAASLLAEQKGVCASAGAGVSEALAASGASWYYNWHATPDSIDTPPGVTFVPMIWGASDVNTAELNEVKREGHVLLGFNEPDQRSQSNMSVNQALSLWPQLEATGMELGSPGVSWATNSPSGWFGQFMQGAQARGYRVDFINVHWYGQRNFTDPAKNVSELKKYLEQTHDLWGKPIWLTEFALTNFQSGPYPVYPTETQQAAFLTAATQMLATLPFVQRYAWYALSASGVNKGTTALYSTNATATAVGDAYKVAP